MSSPLPGLIPCLHAQVASREILLPLREVREVAAPMTVSVLPGRPRGICGVVVHEGEFLPVLAWADLPGAPAPSLKPQALAILRPRLGLLLDQQFGTLTVASEPWQEPSLDEPWRAWLGGMARHQGRWLPVLDADRLVSLLRSFRTEH